MTEELALLVALAEAVLGAVALVGFNVGGGLQYVQNTIWISHFGAAAPIRYHVGMDGLSLFMVLLTAVGIAAAIGAAMVAGRERPRVYFGLLLLLESALVLLFTAQDLVLFYVGWEVMMIPLYVLMGVWGGEGRRRGDPPVRRLHARRVAAHAGRDRRARRLGAHVRAVRAGRPAARVDLALPGLRARVLHQGAALPAARLAAGAPTASRRRR